VFSLRPTLVQCCFRRRHFTFYAPTGEDWNANPSLKTENPMRGPKSRPLHTIIPTRCKNGIALGSNGRKFLLRGLHRGEGRAEVVPRTVSLLQGFVNGWRLEIGIGHGLRDFEGLPERQTDGTAKTQLHDREIIAGNAEIVLFRVKLDCAAS